MGQRIYYKCLSCGEIFARNGVGMSCAFLYCDKCGKETQRDYDELNANLKCECGGTFRVDDDTIICPRCHEDKVEKYSGDENGLGPYVDDAYLLWD